MLRLQLLVCIAAFALAAGTAQANPFSLQVLRTRAVPGPHVQITYGQQGPLGTSPPTLAATFGSKQTPWVTGPYTTNTGSGLVQLSAIQCCDCFVPKGGPLTYRATVGTITLISTVTPSDSFDAAPSPDSSPSDAAVLPWNIPDPAEVQGVDCTAACAGASSDAATTAPDTSVLAVDAQIANVDAPIFPFPVDAPIKTADALTSFGDAPIATPEAPLTAADAPIATVDTRIATADTRIATVDALIATADVPTAAVPDASIAAPATPDAAIATADVPVAVGPDARTTSAGGSTGCCFGGTRSVSGLSLLAGLALLFFRRRRDS